MLEVLVALEVAVAAKVDAEIGEDDAEVQIARVGEGEIVKIMIISY